MINRARRGKGEPAAWAPLLAAGPDVWLPGICNYPARIMLNPSDQADHAVPGQLRQIPHLVPEFWPGVNRFAGNRSWPPASDDELERFLKTAESCRLLPFLANDPAVPPPVLAAAAARWRTEEPALDSRSMAFDREMAELVELLDPSDYFLFKGAVYRHRIYPDRSLRPMDDIDIVTRPETFGRVLRRLDAAGYRPAGKYFVKDRKEVKVEVMDRLAPAERYPIDYDEIEGSLLTGPVGARHPAAHHELVLHTLIMAGQMYFIFARKYLDLWLLARSDAVVAEAIEVAARWKMKRVLHVAMVQMARFIGDERSLELAHRTGALLPPSERRFVERFVVPPSPVLFHQPRPIRAWRRLAFLDTPGIRARSVAAKLAALVNTGRDP
jgi:hypothetical protein